MATRKVSFDKIMNKENVPLDETLLSNHFSQHSFCELTQNEALMKSFELEYEIEDKTGDKILLMNFSKKKKIKNESSPHNPETTVNSNDLNKKFTPVATPTIISMSPKLELLSYEGEENKVNLMRNEKEKNLSNSKFNKNILNENLARTCPNLKFSNYSAGKVGLFKEDEDEIENFNSYHSNLNHKEYIQHVRKSSWESFSNLMNKRKMNQAQKNNFTKKSQENIILNSNEPIFQRSKDFFSFAQNIKENEENQETHNNENIVYLHIPGYMKDEAKEQNFVQEKKSEVEKDESIFKHNLNEKIAVLENLYSLQNKNTPQNKIKKTSKIETPSRGKIQISNSEKASLNFKKNQRILKSSQQEKDKNEKMKKKYENKENVNNFIPEKNKTSKTSSSSSKYDLFKKYIKDMNYFEEARKVNSHIEKLEKQVRNKCL